MKTAEEWYNAFLVNKSPDGDLDMIEQIQKEAYNEAIETAAKNAQMKVVGHYYMIDRELILELRK